MWKIKDIVIENQIVLAPMAGISNPAYIKICEEMGVGYAITELISAEAIVRNNKKTFDMLNGIENLKIPVAVQIFGSEPSTLAQAAKKITELYKNVLIDINMGCPVPKVAVRSQAGAALLKNPIKVKEIISAVVSAVNVPVTVKIRSGWDKEHINAIEIAKICEKAGASAICIHGRTRSQGYSGQVDLDIIKEVKKSVNIPVIGNGDIKNIYDAEKMIKVTGVDAIMIGRGVLGNPWLIMQTNKYLNEDKIISLPTNVEKVNMALQHLNNLYNLKGEKFAVLEIRNHIAWYLKGIKGSTEIKNLVYKTVDINDIINILETFKKELLEENNAGTIQ